MGKQVACFLLGWLLAMFLFSVLRADGLNDAEILMLQSTQLLGSASQAPCREAVNQYLKQRQFVTEHLEQAHPGFTVDWSVIPATLKAKP